MKAIRRSVYALLESAVLVLWSYLGVRVALLLKRNCNISDKADRKSELLTLLTLIASMVVLMALAVVCRFFFFRICSFISTTYFFFSAAGTL